MVSTIGIVSLSSGIIGEDFVKHEVDLGIQRLKVLGLNPIFLPHSLKGLDFIKDHPEARASERILSNTKWTWVSNVSRFWDSIPSFCPIR
ncbi:LD-carboxypeptidase [Streptococcus pneumoniae]|nr:LD-carboxypeptidase [Streptococcus pneumoniae]